LHQHKINLFSLAVLHRGDNFFGTFAPAIEGFFIQFFAAEIFCNLGIHSKNVLMQHKVELIEKYFGTELVAKRIRNKFKKYTIGSKLSLLSQTCV
jgi:hypothetical protein